VFENIELQLAHARRGGEVPYQPRRQKQQQCENSNNNVIIMTSIARPVGT